MGSKQVVIGIFPNEAAADTAVESLKAWDKATADIKLSSIGVLVLDENGNLKTHKMGSRSKAKGAGIGLVLAVVAPPTLLAGMVGGAILGAFHHKGLGLSQDDRDLIGSEIVGGKAAVGVLTASDDEAGMISAKVAELGGTVEAFEVTDEALEAVAEAAPAEADAPSEAAPAS